MILLDTHALLWLGSGHPLREPGRSAIEGAVGDATLCMSAVSAWEIANLVRRGRLRMTAAPAIWFSHAVRHMRGREVDLSSAIAFEAYGLPGWDHRDPADRFLVATARSLNASLVTRDQTILAYAEVGHVRAIPC